MALQTRKRSWQEPAVAANEERDLVDMAEKYSQLTYQNREGILRCDSEDVE